MRPEVWVARNDCDPHSPPCEAWMPRPPSASAEFLQVLDVILEQTCCRCNNAGAAHTIFGLCIAAIKDLVAPSVPRSGEEELGGRGRKRKSAAAEVFVVVDDLGG